MMRGAEFFLIFYRFIVDLILKIARIVESCGVQLELVWNEFSKKFRLDVAEKFDAINIIQALKYESNLHKFLILWSLSIGELCTVLCYKIKNRSNLLPVST